MEQSRRIEQYGLVISQKNIYELCKQLSNYFPVCKIQIGYTNEKTDEMSLEEFKKHDFGIAKIQKFNVSSSYHEYGKNKDSRFEITYDPIFEDFSVKYSSESEQIYCKINTIIESWITTHRKSVSFFKFCNSSTLIDVLFCIISFGVFLISALKYNCTLPDSIGVSLALTAFIGFPISFLIQFSLKKCFPKIEIDIGFNKTKSFRKKWGWTISTIIIPFIFLILSLI